MKHHELRRTSPVLIAAILAVAMSHATTNGALLVDQNAMGVYEVLAGPDCNGNGISDDIDIANGTSADCNENSIPDECDIVDGTSTDFNLNGIPDSCEPDCQPNDIPDFLDIALGLSDDCNLNEIPDECESDCQLNGTPDDCDIADGTSGDCNGNDFPDECDIADGTSLDVNGNSVPDECDLGSCCTGDGGCVVSLLADCPVGAWTLDGACQPNICPQPGACCLEDTSCVVSLELECPSDIWTEGEVCTLANCPAPDCNENGIRDIQDIADGASSDCNANGIPDECEIAGAGTTTVFADGMTTPEDIVLSAGNYPPGVFVAGGADPVIYRVALLDGMVTTFASAVSAPIGVAFAPDEFGGAGERLFVTGATVPVNGPSIHLVNADGTVEPFADMEGGAEASGLTYIPQAIGGLAGGQLFVTSSRNIAGIVAGSLHLVDEAGTVTTLIPSFGTPMFSPALAPDNFGQFASRVFFGDSKGSRLFAFDLATNEIALFAMVPLPGTGQPGLRQLAFSPVGWASSFDPALASERVLLVSEASGGTLPVPAEGAVSVWDQRGKMIAKLRSGPDDLGFEPRGMLFAKNDLLIGDIAEGHGWLIRATIEDFSLPDCDSDGILDECEIAAGSTDCNTNDVPDECEIDCNQNGVADQCDVESGAATDCNGNFVPDSCEGPDCNDNGFPDSCDLMDGTSRDLNGNLIPDECDTFVGDFDDDKDTDLDDYAILESCLAFSGPGVPPVFEACLAVFDFDTDGDVDLQDVRVFQAEFTGSGE